MTTRTTIAAVNTALKAAGIDAVLHRGKGYFYFEGPETGTWFTTTVPVFHLSALDTDGWVRAYLDLRATYGE